MRSLVSCALIFPMLFAFLFPVSTVGVAQQSTTSIRPLPNTNRTFVVEISRTSLEDLAQGPADTMFRTFVRNLQRGFNDHAEFGYQSAGFVCHENAQDQNCTVYGMIDGDLVNTHRLGVIERGSIRITNETTDDSSCHDNAWLILAKLSSRLALAQLQVRNSSSAMTTLPVGPQLALVEAIISGNARAEAGYFNLLPTVQIVTKGYTVKEGDTLSALAQQLTGKASDWSKFDVFQQVSGTWPTDLSLIYPNDKVFLPPELAATLVSSSLPGSFYAVEETTTIAEIAQSTGYGEAAELLQSVNMHIIRDMGSGLVEVGQHIWIPQVLEGWMVVELESPRAGRCIHGGVW